MFGAGAWNCRSSWSSGPDADLSLIVVRPASRGSRPASPTRAQPLERVTSKPSRGMPPYFCHDVDAGVVGEDERSRLEIPITLSTRRQSRGIAALDGPVVAGGWGDRQNPQILPMLVGEGGDRLNGRSSSA